MTTSKRTVSEPTRTVVPTEYPAHTAPVSAALATERKRIEAGIEKEIEARNQELERERRRALYD